MSTAVLRVPGAASAPTPSSMTSTISDAFSTYARRFVFPFPFHEVDYSAPAANEPTASSTDRDRFETPAGLLYDALLESARCAAVAPAEQVEPTKEAVREAVALLRMLPPEVEMPEPVIEPAGAISWLWDRGTAGFLVLALNGRGRVQRSAVINGAESWGEDTLSETLAAEVLALLGHFRVSHA